MARQTKANVWRSKDGVETPISELNDGHLRAIILMVVEKRAPMPPQWPAIVREAKARCLDYLITGAVPPAPPLLPEEPKPYEPPKIVVPELDID